MLALTEKRFTIFVLLFIVILLGSVSLAMTAPNPTLVAFSACLAIVMLLVFSFTRHDFFSPMPMFSIMFFGYVLGGYYYAFSIDSFGKFVDFTNLEPAQTVELMELGLLYATLCFVSLFVGYTLARSLFNSEAVLKPIDMGTNFMHFFCRYYQYMVTSLLVIGLLYWVYVAYQTAGSVWDAILLFQVFPHLIEDAGLSTLPYQLYYAGIYLWLLGIQVSGKKVSWLFVFFSLLGCLICLTTGRIMLSLTYLMAQVFFVALANEHLKKQMLVFFLSIMSLGFVIYFLRILSNYFFLGQDANLFEGGFLQEFLFRIVGSGNVADLQQLAIIFHVFDIGNIELGSTYLDTIRNSIGIYFGFDPSSVGLMLKDAYFPESSGAPTPGAIGEAYVNFNFAAPVVMLCIGFTFYIIHYIVLKSASYIILFVYAMFLVRFVFMYAKVDSTMMSSFLWGVTPMLLCVFVMFSIYHLAVLGHVPSRHKKFKEHV